MVTICSIYVHYMSTDLSEKQQKTNASLCMVHGNSSKLVPCLWPIFAGFQNEFFSSNLNISANYQPN